MTTDGFRQLIDDLDAEHRALDAVVSTIDDDAWATPTASPGWRIAEQIAHLAFFDRTATLAIADPDGFGRHLEEMRAHRGSDPSVGEAELSPPELLAAWRQARGKLVAAGHAASAEDRFAWYGPSMGARSFLTARLMECWAHGVDITDALGLEPITSDRLVHIVHLGFITRGWTYANRRLEMPDTTVRVEVTSPSGATWRHGPDDAPETLSGPAVDFALVTTQRRNVADTELVVSGDAAADWMSKAQLFAGRPSDPPAPRG